MILYNISIIVEDSNHDDLFDWLTQELQQIAYDTKFLKMLDSPHEGTTYCIQTTVDRPEDLQLFQEDVLHKLHQHIAQNHAEKAFIFDSKMEYLSY